MNIITKVLLLSLLCSTHFMSAKFLDHKSYPSLFFEKISFEPETPLIDLLQDGESYTIHTTSLGCFHSCKESFKISRKADVYTVECGELVKTLSENTVAEIRDFEIKLQNLSNGLCTTKDTYELVYGSTVIRVTDDSCMFNGGHKLMRILGCEIPHDN